jgi:hypothetical protein
MVRLRRIATALDSEQRIGEHWSLPDGIMKIQHGVLMRLKGDQLSQQCVSFDCDTTPSCLRKFLLTTFTESQVANPVFVAHELLQPRARAVHIRF